MRILIVGGTGFTGPHVVHRLSELGHALLLYHRGETEADLPESVRHIYGTVSGHNRPGNHMLVRPFTLAI